MSTNMNIAIVSSDTATIAIVPRDLLWFILVLLFLVELLIVLFNYFTNKVSSIYLDFFV